MRDLTPDPSLPDDVVFIISCKRRGQRFAAKVHTGGEFMLPAETVVRFGVRTGGTWPVARWQEVVRDARDETAYQYLLRLLNRRALSVHEAETRVRRKCDRDSAVAAVRRATAAGLLDDQRYATAIAEYQAAAGRHGRRSIGDKLRRRGLAKEVVTEALGAAGLDGPAGDAAEQERALALAQKRWPQLLREPDAAKRQRRLLGYLSRHGFGAGICYTVVRAVASGIPPPER